MAKPYAGPGMTIDNMRALHVPFLDVTCQCGREAIIDVSGLSGLIEVPTLRWRLKCTVNAGRPIDVRPDWTQHRAQGICFERLPPPFSRAADKAFGGMAGMGACGA